ncbi:hypothetical protein PI124_g19579 [Phytophthora idaei]|nr:hypothetical protein PI125_g20661 [Phytophthora idaei]KAG3123740.1 hypothetical protein PI126_g23571 [Phytophthora idaei]KAG3235386.1 hypothetical protein PI124_g19579 [Phytophthora idaei]
MWVMLHRSELPHINYHTNNRVESLFGKVKKNIKSQFPMQSSLEALLAMQSRLNEKYRAQVESTGTLGDTGYSEAIIIVLGMTTGWDGPAVEILYNVAVAEDSLGR